MLELSNISKTFNTGTVDERRALNHLNLTVKDGDFITIIGSNGAGKSTLFNMISGYYITDEGSITLDGEDITLVPDYKRAKYIGRLFQDPMHGSAPGMTIEENLFIAKGGKGWLKGITKKDREVFRERLACLDMGLENRMRQPVGLLSGGQRQALTLLMATFNAPKILLLDEHTAALDPATAEKVLKLTDQIVNKNRLTCMMITHNMESALSSGNRTLMMDSGRIVFDVEGEKRKGLTKNDLLEAFSRIAGHDLDNDRILLEEK